MKRLKEELKYGKKGITLISLVITIIVLLILAGVTIATLTGDNGILTKASKAKEKTQVASEDELRKLTMLEASTNLGNQQYTDKNEDTATIPAGFAISQIEEENTIENGLVIIDANGNEFVWIPVQDINSMIMCKGNNENSICNLVLQENHTLKCETHNSTDLAGRVYDVSENLTQNFVQRNQTYSSESGYHEPDIISLSDNDENSDCLSIAGISSASQLKEQLQDDFNIMANSVANYGGFYVSRYEIGENVSSKKNQKVLVSSSTEGENYIGVNTWYGLYYTLRNTNTLNLNKHMIWRMSI